MVRRARLPGGTSREQIWAGSRMEAASKDRVSHNIDSRVKIRLTIGIAQRRWDRCRFGFRGTTTRLTLL
jgi:hypothetical protein